MLIPAVVFFCSACGPKTINHVMADPARYANKNVQLRGEVIDSYSVIGRGAYRIDDGTGQLWIVSDEGVPRKGAYVSVKGKVKDGFSLGGLIKLPKQIESGVVLLESSHKAANKR